MSEKFYRRCPSCNVLLGYTRKKNRNTAERKKLLCQSCSHKEVEKRPEVILRHKERSKELSIKNSGKGNPFYGRKHSDESRKRMKKVQQGLDKKNNPIYQSEEFREKSKRTGKLNGMYGRNVYSVWLKKYGKKEADERMAKAKKKWSKSSSGKNNGMYGKPSPQGAGNGWSGWYKGWFFRSLKELSYMIKVIEKKGYKWESAEKKKYSIPYIDYKNKKRTYRADFILDNKIMIEVKPKKLMDTPTNTLKKNAALKFCSKNGLDYRMVDIKRLGQKKIIDLFKNKEIILTEKYKKYMENLIEKKKGSYNEH